MADPTLFPSAPLGYSLWEGGNIDPHSIPTYFSAGRLGPPNPWSIFVTTETLGFRPRGFSPLLRLLIPAFSLLTAPAGLAPPPSTR